MKNPPFRYLIRLFFLLSFYCLQVNAQVTNPCGVVARIWPAAADSVVPLNTLIPLTSTSINATSVKWLYDGAFSGITGPLWNYQVSTGIHRISLVAYNGNCSDTTTVVYFSAGTPHNVDSLLMANYGTYDLNEEGTCIDKTNDGGFIIGGVQYLWRSCGEAGIVVKMRDKGCIDWSKKFLSPYYCNNSKITSVYAGIDTAYYVVTNGIELAKLDKNGNLLWNKKYDLDNQGPIGIPYITGDSQGALYIVTNFFFNGWTITKLDKNGNVTWNKFYRLSYDQPAGAGQFEFATPSGLVWLNGKIYVCGNAFSKTNSTYFSFITRLDAGSGAKEWQYGYIDPAYPGALAFTHLALYDTLLMASSGTQGHTVTLVDQQGLVRKSIKTQFGTSHNPKVSRAGADSNGHIYIMQWTEETLPLQPYFQYYTNFAEIDTSLNKYWGMVFSNSSRGYFADAKMGHDNKFGAIGQDFGFVDDGKYGSRDMRFLKVDTVTTEQFCFNNTNQYTISQKTVNRFNFQYLVDSALTIIPVNGTSFTITDAFIQSRYTCPDYIDSCSFMKISGPVNICNYADIYTYRVHRNRKCVLAPQWQLPAGVIITHQTDSSLSLKFPGFGTYRISASLNSCIPVTDSLIITIVSKSHLLNLGTDTTICAGTTLTLHASADFLLYTWNDGSTGLKLNVTQPGIYWVETMDSCSNRLRDSIIITPFINGINIGPDRVSCANDTLHLVAPGGFLNYQWSGNYNINVTNAQHVIVHPAIDTAYYLIAEKLPGCFAYDTIRIKVNTVPVIQLGPDKSFCHGDSLVLNGGSGFTQFLWSNGIQAQHAVVYNAGNYSVTGTTVNGCKSYDTLLIVNVWPNPVVNLDKNGDLCKGTTRTLRAGNYSSYSWQDGSTSPTYTVSGLGTYHVTVIDNQQCKGADTVRIVRMLPVPSFFLPSDTAICSYGDIALMANQTYASYLWNTGETANVETITRPGLYWLSVIDQYGCSGADTVLVLPKDCMKGLYVPTAFSPNLDGKNDLFKPLIFGNVTVFEWKIYSRYGQIIFTSTSPSKGWDGTIQGVTQNTGSFIWVCRFQFAGEKEQVKTGSVILVR